MFIEQRSISSCAIGVSLALEAIVALEKFLEHPKIRSYNHNLMLSPTKPKSKFRDA
jgi:hypothetical protein